MNCLRILVVDDEPAQLELLSGFLKKQGFEVVLGESAIKALEIFRRESIDLIVTDQKMPDVRFGFTDGRASDQSRSLGYRYHRLWNGGHGGRGDQVRSRGLFIQAGQS